MGVEYQIGLYIELNVVCIAMLSIILHRIIVNRWNDIVARHFRNSVICLAVASLADIISCYCSYKQTLGELILFCEMASGVCLILVDIFWVWFIEGFTRLYPPKWLRWLLRIPTIICLIVIALSPFNLGAYWVEQAGVYARGPYYVVKPVTHAFMMVLQLVLIAVAAFRTSDTSMKKEYFFFSIVCIIPVAGVIIQNTIGPSFPVTNPATALALMYGYVGITSRQSRIDYLTGLNNRTTITGLMNTLLAGGDLTSKPSDEKAYYYYMIDVNNFKSINDGYGHAEGDRALIIVADALREAFDGQKGCVCRYGGDEFAALVHVTDDVAVQTAHRINVQVRKLRQRYKLQYQLSVSTGYIRMNAVGEEELKQQLHMADMAMYNGKRKSNAGRTSAKKSLFPF